MVSNGESFCGHTSKTSTCSTTDAIRCTGIFDALKGNHTPRYSVKGELTYTWITLYTLKKKSPRMYLNHSIHKRNAHGMHSNVHESLHTREGCTHMYTRIMHSRMHESPCTRKGRTQSALTCTWFTLYTWRMHPHVHESLYTRIMDSYAHASLHARESYTRIHTNHCTRQGCTNTYRKHYMGLHEACTHMHMNHSIHAKDALTCTWSLCARETRIHTSMTRSLCIRDGDTHMCKNVFYSLPRTFTLRSTAWTLQIKVHELEKKKKKN